MYKPLANGNNGRIDEKQWHFIEKFQGHLFPFLLIRN